MSETQFAEAIAGVLRSRKPASIAPEDVRSIIEAALAMIEVIAKLTKTTFDDTVVAMLRQFAQSDALDRIVAMVLSLVQSNG